MGNTKFDIIIVGGGMAGLSAGNLLSKAGKKILILEAQEEIGGRIRSRKHNDDMLELGAEFIHGPVPYTFELIKSANLSVFKVSGGVLRFEKGELKPSEDFIDGWEIVQEKLQKLNRKISLKNWMEEHFPAPQFSGLRSSLRQFVEGYDAAEEDKIDVLSLKEEWLEGEPEQYKPEGGYQRLILYLSKSITENGGLIYTSQVVEKIVWKEKSVEIQTPESVFSCPKLILTISLGCLFKNTITFEPSIKQKLNTAKNIGFGSVVKILIYFNQQFWDRLKEEGFQIKDLLFIFSELEIPTWWTAQPLDLPLLTGWIGGPGAWNLKESSNKEIYAKSLNVLETMFKLEHGSLHKEVDKYFVANWGSDPFTYGSYSYPTIQTEEARRILNEPIENTIFFAGEALAEESSAGTVEAALESGSKVAQRILSL